MVTGRHLDLPFARLKTYRSSHFLTGRLLCGYPQCTGQVGSVFQAVLWAPHFILMRGRDVFYATPTGTVQPQIYAAPGYVHHRTSGVWYLPKHTAEQWRRGHRPYRRPTKEPRGGEISDISGTRDHPGRNGLWVEFPVKELPATITCHQCRRSQLLDPEPLGLLQYFTLTAMPDMDQAKAALTKAQDMMQRIAELHSSLALQDFEFRASAWEEHDNLWEEILTLEFAMRTPPEVE